MDPKVRNLSLFVLPRVAGLALIVWSLVTALRHATASGLLAANGSVIMFLGLQAVVVVVVLLWRVGLAVVRRLLVPPKSPLQYGKWAIVTGSTSGIGEEFTRHLHAQEGMSILLVSRSKEKLAAQVASLAAGGGQGIVRYLVHDFTTRDAVVRTDFYAKLKQECSKMSADGGLGLLVNNVGMANEIPKALDELSDEECEDLLHCNTHSTVFMTRAVLPIMKQQHNGAVICVSSGSGNHPGPFISVYSATKAFMTQFSRSMHVECWDSGVDFLVVTPFYIVSNLFKRRTGTIIAPMPDVLVRGTLAQLGKKYVWQGHGYWFHGLLGNLASYYPETTRRWRKMMVDNRKRWDRREAKKKR